jgi:hypothetical protein
MSHVPCCFLAADFQMPLKLQRAHSFFRVGNESHGKKHFVNGKWES